MVAVPDTCDVNGARVALAVVVPVYRNAATLPELARRIDAAVRPLVADYRLILVVDASPDTSGAIALRLARDGAQCDALVLPANVGQHRAVLIGLSHVDADAYAVLDADLQDPPEVLPAMIAASTTGTSVFALRRGRYQGRGRMITSRAVKSVVGGLIDLPREAGTFLLVSRRTRNAMLACGTRHPQVVVLARCFSSAWTGVAYTREHRRDGHSAYSRRRRFAAGWTTLRCVVDCRRALRRARRTGTAEG